jgi:hypothetical protein
MDRNQCDWRLIGIGNDTAKAAILLLQQAMTEEASATATAIDSIALRAEGFVRRTKLPRAASARMTSASSDEFRRVPDRAHFFNFQRFTMKYSRSGTRDRYERKHN